MAIGDRVRLNSGGRLMVVAALFVGFCGATARVFWLDVAWGQLTIRSRFFPAAALSVVEQASWN